jgi:response regulator RpfG family c-di-GMP phosphodiesterase
VRSTAPRTGTGSGGTATAEDLLRLRDVAQSPSIDRALEAIRQFLGMDVAYVSRIDGTHQHFETIDGDAESFGISEGEKMPLDQTFCQRILSGRLPNLIPDVQSEPRAVSLEVAQKANVGSYVAMPLRFSDGSLHGTLCAASHEANPSLGYRELQFLHVFARMVADLLERESLERENRDYAVQAAAAQTLIAAVEARDAYTGEHSRNVVAHAGAVARRLGLSETKVAETEQVAMLHDIGKLAIPDTILGKPGPLDEDEWETMRSHSIRGEQLISNTPGLTHLAQAIRSEHERWDGTGYPDGLSGDQIPLASRITFVCDAYHAMTSDRPYRAALSEQAARTEIAAGAGSQFCPTCARALLEILEVGS